MALAQPLIKQIDSIEARALNSQFTCIARITVVKPDNVGNADVQVERVFKSGLLVGTMHLDVKAEPEQLAKWRDSKARLLIFENSVIDLSDPDLEVVTSDRKVLRSSSAVIDAVAQVYRKNPGVFRIDTCTRGMITLHGEQMSVRIPVDESLHQQCLQTIKFSTNQAERWEAVLHLEYFPSNETTELLKSLLTDSGTMDDTTGRLRYAVRMIAWDRLHMVGIDAPKPKEYKD